MSKGDNRRPAAVKREEFERRWEETFEIVPRKGRDAVIHYRPLRFRVTGRAAEALAALARQKRIR